MISAFFRKRFASVASVALVVLVILVAALPAFRGCQAAPAGNSPALSQKDLRVVKLLRFQTDELLRDIATADYGRVRQYFSSDADVNVMDQLQQCFGAPLGRLQIVTWDAEKILVELDRDGRHARTGARVRVREPSGQTGYRGVVFNWVSADATCQIFHLVPQKS